MLVLLEAGADSAKAKSVENAVRALGCECEWLEFGGERALRVASGACRPDFDDLISLPGVERVLPGDHPFPRSGRGPDRPPGGFSVGDVTIGGGGLTVIAGPCAVEDEERLLTAARAARDAGADLLRGGAFKPRSSPYEFQGLGLDGLRMLRRAGRETGLPVISEAVSEASLALVEEHADIVQIGARNMQNFELLKRAGRSPLPVLIKRGLAARLDDLLLAAEYLMDQGNQRVILCERGIRTFSDHSRFTLDLSAIPVLREATHLPLFVDPSHASGAREIVPALARAAVAVGADGLMLEVHPDPERALCDGRQSMRPEALARLLPGLRALHAHLSGTNADGARRRETVP